MNKRPRLIRCNPEFMNFLDNLKSKIEKEWQTVCPRSKIDIKNTHMQGVVAKMYNNEPISFKVKKSNGKKSFYELRFK